MSEEQKQLETPETSEEQATVEGINGSETVDSGAETPEVEATDEQESLEAVSTPEEATTETETATEEEAPTAEVEETPAEETAEPAVDEVEESTTEEPTAEEPVAEGASEEAAEVASVEEEAAAPVAEAETEEPETVDEPEASTETPAEPEVEEAQPEEALPIGYKGEITGKVVRLEDLEAYQQEEEAVANHDELLALIEQTLTDVSEHEIVKGRIVSIGEKDIVIDIGFKSDGVVARNEFEDELTEGDEVEVYLERIEDYHGQLVLSKLKADKFRRWERIEQAFEHESVLEGTIVRRIKGGMIVELFDGIEAFLPGSQIDVRPVRDFDAYLEKRMEFKIVKINPTNENVVVSHKALIEKELEAQRENILSTMEPGQILEGTVKNITDFGVFIDLGGVDGLLHITDLSWGRVSHPSELVELDQQLKVVVLDYDKERQRISLGLKQLQSHPWENISERFNENDEVEGKVVSITDYGAFVELEKGIEGLVHISEMSWTDHIRHPSQKVSLGQIVKVKILNIDHDGKKISLGMKQLEPNPWQGLAERYPAGTVLNGTVRNITNFGVFAEIEPGIDGLVHISDLSWTKKIRHPGEIIKKGQGLSVVILDIDEERQRVSLGHKQIETNPWNDFANVYADGTDHDAKIVRIEEKGLAVELPLEVEGFVPAGELKNSQNFKSNYQEGDTLNLRVTRFDLAQREILLSEREKDRDAERSQRELEQRERRQERAREERAVRDYKKKAASGPTTLGELSGLEDLKAQMVAAEQAAEAAKSEDVAPEPEATVEEAVETVVEAEETEATVEEAEAVVEEATAEAEPEVEEAEAVAEEATAEETTSEAEAEGSPEATEPVAEAVAEAEVEEEEEK